MDKKIRVLFKAVGKESKELMMKDTLRSKQEKVGGYIEVIPYINQMLIICDEEGKLKNKLPNIIGDYGYIAGEFIIVGDDYDNAGFRSLTDAEIKIAKEDIGKRSVKYLLKEIEEYERTIYGNKKQKNKNKYREDKMR